jgi:hypothetical protein
MIRSPPVLSKLRLKYVTRFCLFGVLVVILFCSTGLQFFLVHLNETKSTARAVDAAITRDNVDYIGGLQNTHQLITTCLIFAPIRT